MKSFKLISFTDTLLALLLHHQQDSTLPRLPGLAPSAEQALSSLGESGEASYSPKIAEELQTMLSQLLEAEDAEPYSARFGYLCNAFELGKPGILALLLALCSQLDRKYEPVFTALENNPGVTAPTIGIVWVACRLLGCDDAEAIEYLFSPTVMNQLFIVPENSIPDLSFPLLPHQAIIRFFHGISEMDPILHDFCRVHSPSAPLPEVGFGQDLVDRLTHLAVHSFVDGVCATPIMLVGRSGSGRRFFLRHIAARLGLYLLSADFPKWCALSEERLTQLLECLKRELVLHPGMLALTDCSEDLSPGKAARIIAAMAEYTPLLWITATQEGREVAEYSGMTLCEIHMPEPGFGESECLFAQKAGEYRLEDSVKVGEMVQGYRMLPGEVQNAFMMAQLSAYQRNSSLIERQDLMHGISSQRNRAVGGLGTVITPCYTWDDFVTSPTNAGLMRLAVDHVKYRRIVGEEWGMDYRNAYGKGVCILLYGPPGTGKSMAAHVLAHEVGMDLFRVDASQLVSKYIGETSKNMGEVFRQAQKGNMVLFFDEADAIFGRRGEVNDSHDRYANNDTAYLLQQVEEFDGMTILSTNLASNMDEAFRRRITYAVNLVMPNQIEREELWKKTIHSGIPTGAIDYSYLSGFELNSSAIKSIVLSACYMAAGAQQCLSTEILVKALYFYRMKTGKNIARKELYPYGDFLFS